MTKGIVYIFLGVVFTPIVLARHPVLAGVQTTVFVTAGVLRIFHATRKRA